MHTFVDTEGAEWSVHLTLGTEAAVHASVGVYLSDISTDNPTLARLEEDPVLFGNVLFVLCREQALKQNLDKPKFLDRFYGTALEQARESVVLEVLSFLGSRGETLLRTKEQKDRIDREIAEDAAKNLEKLTGAQALHLLSHAGPVLSALGSTTDSAGKSPVLSALTPEDSPSDS